MSLLALGLASPISADVGSVFRHPGAMNTAASLDWVKAKIDEGKEPWTSTLQEVEQKALPASAALAVIDAGDVVIDGSVRNKLVRLNASLAN